MINVTNTGRTHLNAPASIGAILTQMLQSDSPLATGFRQHAALHENGAEKGDEA